MAMARTRGSIHKGDPGTNLPINWCRISSTISMLKLACGGNSWQLLHLVVTPILIHSGLGSVFFSILDTEVKLRLENYHWGQSRSHFPPAQIPCRTIGGVFLLILFNQFPIIQNRWIQSLTIAYIYLHVG